MGRWLGCLDPIKVAKTQ